MVRFAAFKSINGFCHDLEKKISEENYEKIMKLGDKSIKPEEKVLRIYPQKNLFSHIIGQIDDNNNGISGLEKSFNEILGIRQYSTMSQRYETVFDRIRRNNDAVR